MAHPSSMALIPTGPLVTYDELIHKDLQVWSKELYEEMTSLRAKIEEDPSEACISLNQAALVSALLGELESAMNLCHIQIKMLVNSRPSQAMTSTHLLTILQPWINMGRLYNIEKKYSQAIDHFDLVSKLRNKTPLDLIYVQVSNEQLQELIACQESGEKLHYFMWVNYINEMIRLMIKSKDFTAGFSFLQQQKEEAPFDFSDLLTESEVILLAHTGSYAAAITTIKRHRTKSIINKMIFLYHRALCQHLDDSEDAAKSSCQRLASYLKLAMSETSFIKLKRLMHLAGALCAQLGLAQQAYELHLKGYELSKRLQDHRYATIFAAELSKSTLASSLGNTVSPPQPSQSTTHFERLNSYIVHEYGGLALLA